MRKTLRSFNTAFYYFLAGDINVSHPVDNKCILYNHFLSIKFLKFKYFLYEIFSLFLFLYK